MPRKLDFIVGMALGMLLAFCKPAAQNAPATPTARQDAIATAITTPQATDLPRMTPYPDVIEVTQRDRTALAALCWVEVRGFNDVERIDACYSVISTVTARATYHLMSDGTVRGALAWGCTKSTQECQFPRYAWDGCQGINASICPYNSPQMLLLFQRIVDRYFDSGERGSCDGYLFYGDKFFDLPECQIHDGYGSYLNFHGKPRPRQAQPSHELAESVQ